MRLLLLLAVLVLLAVNISEAGTVKTSDNTAIQSAGDDSTTENSEVSEETSESGLETSGSSSNGQTDDGGGDVGGQSEGGGNGGSNADEDQCSISPAALIRYELTTDTKTARKVLKMLKVKGNGRNDDGVACSSDEGVKVIFEASAGGNNVWDQLDSLLSGSEDTGASDESDNESSTEDEQSENGGTDNISSSSDSNGSVNDQEEDNNRSDEVTDAGEANDQPSSHTDNNDVASEDTAEEDQNGLE